MYVYIYVMMNYVIHLDFIDPPGYKFNIFYPDLIDKAKAPTYHVEKSDTADTVREPGGNPGVSR
jgi:hypothetical protein